MQSRSPLFDEFAKAIEGALGVAQAASEEAKAVIRAQADRLATEFDLVRRDEFEAMRSALEGEIAGLRAEVARMKASADNVRLTEDAG
jgi:BMFP domain-containing protein YqiC